MSVRLLSADLLIYKAALVGVVGLDIDKVQSVLAVLPLSNTLTTNTNRRERVLWSDPAIPNESLCDVIKN